MSAISGPYIVPNGGMVPTICNADESVLIATMTDTGDQMEATARLLAAAPELLAALRGLLDALERDIPRAASINTGPMGAARAAIAKAEG